jgi:hypothetical protein
MLQEALPQPGRGGLLNPNAGNAKTALSNTEAGPPANWVQLQPLPFDSPEALDGVFAIASRDHLDALVVITDGVTFNQRARIAIWRSGSPASPADHV